MFIKKHKKKKALVIIKLYTTKLNYRAYLSYYLFLVDKNIFIIRSMNIKFSACIKKNINCNIIIIFEIVII